MEPDYDNENLIHLDELSGDYCSEWRVAFREAIKSKFGGKCMWCNSEFDDHNSKPFTIEHIYPQSKYPDLKYYWGNLGGACPQCNNSKGDKPWLDWFRSQPSHNKQRENDIIATLKEWDIFE